MTFLVDVGFYLSISIIHDTVSSLGIASGIWLPEEWPEIMDRPYLASSLNELWGKRWHQALRVSDTPPNPTIIPTLPSANLLVHPPQSEPSTVHPRYT